MIKYLNNFCAIFLNKTIGENRCKNGALNIIVLLIHRKYFVLDWAILLNEVLYKVNFDSSISWINKQIHKSIHKQYIQYHSNANLTQYWKYLRVIWLMIDAPSPIARKNKANTWNHCHVQTSLQTIFMNLLILVHVLSQNFCLLLHRQTLLKNKKITKFSILF